MLNNYDKDLLLKSFPKIELSYEKIVHKKVYNYSCILLIPEGKKCYAWFTHFKNENVCIILELNEHGKVYNMNMFHCCFDEKLSYGTIFYGTLFFHNKSNYFSIQDINYYKGKNIVNEKYLNKLNLFYYIFNHEIKQISYTNNSIIFGLPNISNYLDQTIVLPYKIKYIQFRINENNNGNNCFNLLYNDNIILKENVIKTQEVEVREVGKREHNFNKKELVFQVKPDIQNDIYHLYLYNENNELYLWDTAYIPDYKTSVMMNKHFRIIKENDNLDALEESDSEEEFQNNNCDKFVYLNKTLNMICKFTHKFKKWVPIKTANSNQPITYNNELICLEKNKH